jgi:hypothetical protein
MYIKLKNGQANKLEAAANVPFKKGLIEPSEQ